MKCGTRSHDQIFLVLWYSGNAVLTILIDLYVSIPLCVTKPVLYINYVHDTIYICANPPLTLKIYNLNSSNGLVHSPRRFATLAPSL